MAEIHTLNIIRLSKVLMLKQGKFLGPNVNMNYTKLHEIGNLLLMLKQGKFLGPNVNMNYTKLHEIGNLQMKCKQSL